MKQLAFLATAAFIGVCATQVSAQTPFTANFDTDQSANFSVANIGLPAESTAVFSYDHSTHVQQSGAAITIPPAPNTVGGTTRALRLNCNLGSETTASGDSIVVYPNYTAADAEYVMTFDLWCNYNGGGAAGLSNGSGSTNQFTYGATTSNTLGMNVVAAATGTGYLFSISVEGGASQDYRFFNGTGSITRQDNIAAPNTPVIWWGTNTPDTTPSDPPVSNFFDSWQNFFPDADTATLSTIAGTAEVEGTPGKRWITVRITVDNGIATIGFKRVGDTDFTQVGQTAVAAGTRPFVGFSDINAGAPSPLSLVSDQFVLIDNLTVEPLPTPPPVSAAENWAVYQ